MSDPFTPPPGWYRDPFGQADGRYWNGSMWTEAVSRGGVTLKVAPDPTQATVPPVPGSELRAPVAAGTDPAPTAPRSSAGPIIVAILVVLVLAAGLFLLVSRDDSDQPTTSTVTPATDTPVTTPATTPVTTPPVTEAPVTTPTTAAP